MFCPACKSDYRPGFTHCSDCAVDLVAELPKPQVDVNLSKLKSVWSGKDQERCVSLCEKFRGAGIPFNVTLEELDHNLPNGFHDAQIFSFGLDYAAGIAKFHLNLLVGWPDDPEPERQAYQEARLVVKGLCFCSIDPPYSTYPFLPEGEPILVTGVKAKDNAPPFVPDLVEKLPAGSWCYRFFVDNWNACINIAGRDAELTWVGEKPKHAV